MLAHAFQTRLGEFVPLSTASKATFHLVTASLTEPTLGVGRCFSGVAWWRNYTFRVIKVPVDPR